MTSTPARVVQRHRFSYDIRSAVRSCSRPDNWHGPLEALEHWLIIGASIGLSMWAWGRLPLVLAAAVYLVAVFLIGGRQRALAGLLHQACHGTLMASRSTGRVLGTAFGGYPVLQSFTGYRRSHVRDHHGRLGDPARDPDYVQYQRYGICGTGGRREVVRRHLRSLAGPRSTASYIAYLLRHRIWNRDEERAERALRVGLTFALVAAAAYARWLVPLAAYWLVPLVTTQVWIGGLAELWEHYPLIESAPRVDIYMSWNRDTGPWARFLIGEKKGEGYHLVHHLFPGVPLWRLAQVDQILRDDPAYAALPRLHGVLPAVSAVVASLPAKTVD